MPPREATPKTAPRRGLSPVFIRQLKELNSLPAVNYIAATSEVGITADLAAERMQRDYQMSQKFTQQLTENKPFSPDVLSWSFTQLTGIKLPQQIKTKSNLTTRSIAIGVSANISSDHVQTLNSRQDLNLLMDNVQANDGLFGGWEEVTQSELQQMIAQAAKDPDACLLGGGLPPVELILAFHDNVFLPALERMKKWSDKEKVEVHQYPNAGGAVRHRESVIDHFLRPNERQVVIDNFSNEHRAEGLFFTNGSQEALSMMVEMLTTQEKATKENPVEMVITDPTYPGLLMAADKFLKQGILKFRIISIDNNGRIDTQALNKALSNPRCKAFYLAEGNPLPRQITNFKEVSEVFKRPENQDKLVFDDHAYDGLGATEENNLFDLLPNRVVSFKTLSKKAAPFRVGFVYSNMTPDRFKVIRESMLTNRQFNGNLGFSGVLSGTVAAILQLDAETAQIPDKGIGVFTEHIQKAQAYYEAQRKLYETSYKEALGLAFGEDEYDLDDEVVIGKKMFMFGWRNTHKTKADDYAKIGTEIKLFSLTGSSCRPKPEYIIDDQSLESPTLHHLRQNYTWIKPENLQIGVFKDVLLEVALSDTLQPDQKNSAVEKLYSRMKELNENNPLPEVEQFVEKMVANGWQHPMLKS